jgi:Tol biopolymer transport system component
MGTFPYDSDFDINVMNADGSGLMNLTNSQTTSNSTRETDPAWSPDGTKILFTADYDVWKMKLDGTNRMNLTKTTTKAEWGPDWQPLPTSYDAFSGFFSPVNDPPTLNVVKAGSAVPVKFSLGGDEGLDVFAEGYPKTRRIDCSSSAPLDAIGQTTNAAGGSGLSYDATTGRYTYVWKTQKAWSGTCRQLVVKLDDGSVHRANFKFK